MFSLRNVFYGRLVAGNGGGMSHCSLILFVDAMPLSMLIRWVVCEDVGTLRGSTYNG